MSMLFNNLPRVKPKIFSRFQGHQTIWQLHYYGNFPTEKVFLFCPKIQKNTLKKTTRPSKRAQHRGALAVKNKKNSYMKLIHANIHSFLCCCMFLGNLLQDELVAQWIVSS